MPPWQIDPDILDYTSYFLIREDNFAVPFMQLMIHMWRMVFGEDQRVYHIDVTKSYLFSLSILWTRSLAFWQYPSFYLSLLLSISNRSFRNEGYNQLPHSSRCFSKSYCLCGCYGSLPRLYQFHTELRLSHFQVHIQVWFLRRLPRLLSKRCTGWLQLVIAR
jgi:hypothetical protein